MNANEKKLAERFPSMRDFGAPTETADVTFDETVVVSGPVEGGGAALDDGTAGGPPPSPEAQPVIPAETVTAQEAVRRADMAVDAARHKLGQSKAALTVARQNVAKRLAEYNRSVPVMTPEQNIRAHLTSNQAEKARLAAAGQIPYRPNVTETARAMSGGGHGRGNVRRGGGGAYRRGPDGLPAFSKADAVQINAQRVRDARQAELARMNGSNAPRVKLPSER